MSELTPPAMYGEEGCLTKGQRYKILEKYGDKVAIEDDNGERYVAMWPRFGVTSPPAAEIRAEEQFREILNELRGLKHTLMLTAGQARALTEAKMEPGIAYELELVEEAVKTAIERKQYTTKLKGKIFRPATLNHLHRLGYTVNYRQPTHPNDSHLLKISW